MERRVRGNPLARCGVGEKLEMTSKTYLSLWKDITEQPELAAQRIEEGYWKGDTVVGKRAGKEAVILSLLEKKPQHYFILRIPWKDSASILQAMQQLKEEYGEQFAQVFKTITANIHTNNRVNDQ